MGIEVLRLRIQRSVTICYAWQYHAYDDTIYVVTLYFDEYCTCNDGARMQILSQQTNLFTEESHANTALEKESDIGRTMVSIDELLWR